MNRPATAMAADAAPPVTETAARWLASGPRRELYFFNLYRLLQAALLTGLCFSPLGERLIVLVSGDVARGVALAWLVTGVGLLIAARRQSSNVASHALIGVLIDICVVTAAFFSIAGLEAGIGALLIVNVCAAALLLPARDAYPVALLAGAGVVFGLGFGSGGSQWLEATLFAASYLGATFLMQTLGERMRQSEARIESQQTDLVEMSQLNALILKRLRTGVLVVDRANRIRQINDAAAGLLGRRSAEINQLLALSPELAQRIDAWRQGRSDSSALLLGKDETAVIPRAARLGAGPDDLVLVFLEDVSVMSEQAEQLTLTSLGRLSASIAHEIRNPLAAIRYAAELLGEEPALGDEERRLVEIIRGQCGRMNGIVDNILLLARRERSQPTQIELVSWCREWLDEFTHLQALDQDTVELVADQAPVSAQVDPTQLRQVIWNLVQNARRYGRDASGRAQVSVFPRQLDDGRPAIEVIDRGPGLTREQAAVVFEPFFTTGEHSTGLGLYISRQLCEANLARLDYIARDTGACFRITLASPDRSPSWAAKPAIAGKH